MDRKMASDSDREQSNPANPTVEMHCTVRYDVAPQQNQAAAALVVNARPNDMAPPLYSGGGQAQFYSSPVPPPPYPGLPTMMPHVQHVLPPPPPIRPPPPPPGQSRSQSGPNPSRGAPQPEIFVVTTSGNTHSRRCGACGGRMVEEFSVGTFLAAILCSIFFFPLGLCCFLLPMYQWECPRCEAAC